MMPALDLTNQTFGKLTVLSPAEKISGETAWSCKCECGTNVIVKTALLRRGRTRSCGCLYRGLKNATKHGHTSSGHRSSEYSEYVALIRKYKERMCQKWGTFAGFIDDMGAMPEGAHIYRVDTSLPFNKENCRWGIGRGR